jgi:competence ComEA-like helix-hairpin-helix protein
VKLHSFVITSALAVLTTAIASGASAPQVQAKPPVKVDPAVVAKSVGEMTAEEEEQFSAAAESTMERVCVMCHPFENIIKTRRTVREWSDQVTVMAGRGAPGTAADFALVKKYLTRYYGIVRVNTATAEELTSVLGLSPKAASAVVEYRTAHGNIPDLDTFLKVDGVDKARIEEQPEALRFN